jgi:hypothetical protein
MAAQSPLKGSSGRSGWIAPLIVLPLVVGLVFAAHSWVKTREKRVAGAEVELQAETTESRQNAKETERKVAHSSDSHDEDSYESPKRTAREEEGKGLWAWFKGLFGGGESDDKQSRNKMAHQLESGEGDLTGEHSDGTGANGQNEGVTTRKSAVVIPVASSDDCPAYEVTGLGPERERVSRADWKEFMALYHESKASLLKWVTLQDGKWTPEQIEKISALIKNQKIQRPPTFEEPDLSWRGVSVLTQDPQENPLLRVGGGFVRLVQTDTRRARFELTRLLAQVVLPCELKAQKVESPWATVSACFGVTEEAKCEAGTYSDLGWAISSAVAREVSPPGCKIPAFAEVKLQECVQTALALPVSQSRSVASKAEAQ